MEDRTFLKAQALSTVSTNRRSSRESGVHGTVSARRESAKTSDAVVRASVRSYTLAESFGGQAKVAVFSILMGAAVSVTVTDEAKSDFGGVGYAQFGGVGY